MKLADILNVFVLGLVWGLSFLLVRVAAPEFGAVALIEVRVVLAALLLLPVLILCRGLPDLRRHWRAILAMGVLHYAVPFCLFAWAMLTLTSGYAAIINASSPLFAGVIARFWLGERMRALRIVGLATGFAGVVLLVRQRLGANQMSLDLVLAVGAALLASSCYAVGAVLARKHLSGVRPIAVAGGSMAAAAIVLAPVALWSWPEVPPSPGAWSMAVLLGAVCTALAFVLYFRLIANVGPTRAIVVTFLIPVFAVVAGAAVLGERLTAEMLAAGAVVFTGTALSTGLLRRSPNGQTNVTGRSGKARTGPADCAA